MKCECGSETKTKDTRKIEQGVWRRRACPECGKGFTTLEQRCETIRTPYTSKVGARAKKGQVVAPDVPKVDKPLARSNRKPAPISIPPKTDKTYPTPKVVDRLTPTARDRIEDMKFEREQKDHGWDK